MPTKTGTPYNETHIESPNVEQTVKVEDDYAGTAIELLRALEESNAVIGALEVGVDLGTRKVTVFGQHGDAGEPQPVPEALHDQLTDWGFAHVGDDGDASYKHTDAVKSHVYRKP